MRVFENHSPAPSRRALIKSGLAGGFVLAFHLPVRATPVNEPEQPPDDTAGKFAPNAFIRIDHAGKTTLVMPQVEMGQGVYTALAMILCDELDGDYAGITLEHAPPNDKLYANPMLGLQATGNSNSIRAFWKPLRTAGAATRAMLIEAAAMQWQVDPATCTASNGKVMHAASGRALGYGDLVDAAGALPVPADPPLKDPKNFTLIGKPLKRFDTPNKTDGKVIYGIDTMLPGMKFATLAQCPGLWRQSSARGRQRCQSRHRRSADCRAGRSGRRRRRSYGGRQEGARCPCHHMGRRAERQNQFERHLGGLARRQQKDRRHSQNPLATSTKAWPKATGSTPTTSCRSWRMPPWSR